jgi:hypothetical protein
MQLTLNEAQNQLPQLLQSVSEGQEVLKIAKDRTFNSFCFLLFLTNLKCWIILMILEMNL